MATKIQYLTYYIHLTDADQVAAYQAQYPNGVNRAIYNPDVGGTGQPGGAVIEFDAPFRGYTEPAAGTAPFIWTPWSGYGSQGGPYPLKDATFQRHTGGFLGIGGTTTRYYWMGKFVYAPPAAAPTVDGTPVPVVVPIAQRRMVEGFEVPQACFGVNLVGNGITSAAASRHVGGLGLAIRDSSSATFALTSIGLTVTDRSDGWDRFYVRVNQLPSVAIGIWRCNAYPTGGNGAALAILPSGELAVENLITGGTRSLLGTVGLIGVDTWAKVDVIYQTNPAPTGGQGRIRVWVNGVLGGTFTVASGVNGFGTNSQTVQSIQVGNVHGLSGPVSIDVDDYVSSEVPKLLGVEDLRGQDWLNGSKVVIARASGHASAHSGWAGDFRIATQTINGAWTSEQDYTTSTSGATLAVTTEAERWVDSDPGALGVAAMQVTLASQRGANSGTLGYKLGAAAAVLSAISQNGANLLPTFVMYRPSGILPPAWPDITPLELHHVKGSGADASTARYLCAQIEMIGTFQSEDLRVTEATDGVVPTFPDRRMAPWHRWSPRSPWAIGSLSAPIAPYIIFAGTYAGNSTGQDLLFRSPVNFFFFRRTSGATPLNGIWYCTMFGPHVAGARGIRTHAMAEALEDLSFAPADGEDVQQQRYKLRLVGSDAETNASGSTYQYVAISDPGMRFLCGTDFVESSSQTADITQRLPNPDFLPDLTILQIRETGDTTITNHLGVKGSGHATATMQTGTGTLASAMEHQAGALLTKSALHSLNGNTHAAALCLRRADGNNDAGQAAVLSVGTYTGDGVAARSLTVGTAGKRPLWAMVWPDNAQAIHRDPGHTTTNSSDLDGGAFVTTGITAGAVDGFSVGSSLNSNGIIYHYFVLWSADNVAGNGGWGTNPAGGEIVPLEANSPADGPWPDDPPEPTDEGEPPVVIPGEPDLDTTTPLPGTDLFCATFSEKAVNLALSRIGVSKTIGNLVTDVTKEAELGRLHIKADVEMVLSRFPWEFARKYATLTLVAGEPSDPVNADWTFSYRRPTDCVFERRIAAARGNAVNPTPPAFALGRDSSGGLIFCNEEDAQLEYTARGLCPAYEGDDLFKEALVWKLAASLAPALSRMPDKIAGALEQYEATIAKAYDVMRPNAPGPVTEADPAAFDQTATAAAANLAVINAALIRIGARTIPSIAADSREALSVRVVFESELQSALRGFAWAFATRYAELALVAGPATWDDPLVQTYDVARTYEENDAVIVGSVVYYALRQTLADYPDASPLDWTTELPDDANADWLRAYRLPDDSVFARRLVKPGGRRTYDPDPLPFKLGTDEGGDLLYTDAEQPVLEYTSRLNATVSRSDALFKDALAWRLAAALAPSLAQIDPEEVEQGRGPDATSVAQKSPSVKANKAAARERVARWAMANYLGVLEQAKVSTANEKQDEPDGDAPWITGR